MSGDPMSTSRQFCTFHLNGLFFGIEVVEIQEVIRYQEMTRVPLAPAMVTGLINLRGQIVTAIDLRTRLEFPPREGDLLPTNVVVRTEDGPVSFLVDEIGDVVEVDDAAFESPPGNLTGLTRDVTRGVYKLHQRLLLILDTRRILHIESFNDSNLAPGEHARVA
jgi:purine-binding chemotaxis protein CheW